MILNINNHKFKVKTVFTPKDTSHGMMGKRFEDFNGMLFLMGDGKHCFWMKNCIINLDIIFIDNNKITKIHHDCKPCKTEDCDNYCGIGDMILEIPGGYCKELDIKEGDIVKI